MAFRHFYRAALALALAAYPMTLAAQQEGGTEDRVVARVNGEEVRQSDVMAMARTLPAEYQAQLMAIYPMLVRRLVDYKLAGKAGRDAGLATDDPGQGIRRKSRGAGGPRALSGARDRGANDR